MKPSIDEIIVGDEPDPWIAAGFSIDNDGLCRIGTVRVRLAGRTHGKRILQWSMRNIADWSADPASLAEPITGLITTRSDVEPSEPSAHPNGSLLIDHVVVVTPDCDRTIAEFEALGFPALRTRTTGNYGAPMRQTFFRAGEVIIELVGPEQPSGDGPAAFFGLAITVSDLDRTAALLGSALGEAKDATQPGRRIATLRHRQLGSSVAIAFISVESDLD